MSPRFVASLLTLALVALPAGAARAQSGLIAKVGLPVTSPGEFLRMPPTTAMYCLSAAGTTQGSAVTIRRCTPLSERGAAAIKEWSVTPNGTGPIRHVASGLCVDARQSDQALVLWSCHGGWNQQFTNPTTDEFRLGQNNTCVTVPYGTPRAGAALSMAPCRPNDANQAFYRTA